MRLPIGWLRDFVPVPAEPSVIAERLGACGFEVASIDGDVIDLEITANRPDCLTIAGLAREVAAAFDLDFEPRPAFPHTASASAPSAAPSNGPSLPIALEHEGCGRFAMALVDVTVGPSPAWLSDRLVAAGVRPINNVVDVTNYVMLERHPMHAFDASKLAGQELHVRAARRGERLTTLDGQDRALDEDVLIVADRDRPVSIAGIMGGGNSEISTGTSRIALEAAWWQPAQIRRTARRLSLKTEAAARFERGADIDGPPQAIARALELLEAIGAGRPAGPVTDLYPRPAAIVSVGLRRTRVARLLGDIVPDAEIVRILTRLGFGVATNDDGWSVQVPTFRVDVRREPDLIEEIGRQRGFDRIAATFPPLRTAPVPPAPAVSRGRTIRRVLTSAGLQEAATFTFIEQAAAAPFTTDVGSLVAIANPLSEKFAVLRPSLLPGLLDALIYSRRRESTDVRLFETGAVFSPLGERQAIAWVMTGAHGDHWASQDQPLDFFDSKGIAELLGRTFGVQIEAEVADLPWLVAGRTARLVARGDAGPIELGHIGQIRPELAATRGLGDRDAVVAGEIDVARLMSATQPLERRMTPIPRQPSIVRDLSIVVDERLPAAAVRGTIRSNAPATLVAVREFDRYQGRGVADGRVSLSMRLTFRVADRTLTDAEVQQAVDAIVAALGREHDATLRGPAS